MAEVVKITQRRPRRTLMTPFREIEPLLNQLRVVTDSSNLKILRTIGYESASSFSRWRSTNSVPLRVKYALVGMAAEFKLRAEAPPPSAQSSAQRFSLDQLADLFALARGQILEEGKRRALLRKLVEEIAEFEETEQ